MANNTNNKSHKKKKNKSGARSIRRLREGRLLSIEFFRRHAWLIIIAVVVVLALIGQRYTNQSKRREIKKLEQQLATAKSDQVAEKAGYMSLIRENEMRRLLRQNNIDLDYQEQPPYVIDE